MRTLYLDCGMGAAGDMLMGALLELLPEPEVFLTKMRELDLPGIEITAKKSRKCGISGTHMEVLCHGQECAAVGQRAALHILAEQLPILHKRGGCGLCRGFKSKYQHSASPSITILRSLSESFVMGTFISSPKNASCTFSLHSTAHTAPRLR